MPSSHVTCVCLYGMEEGEKRGRDEGGEEQQWWDAGIKV